MQKFFLDMKDGVGSGSTSMAILRLSHTAKSLCSISATTARSDVRFIKSSFTGNSPANSKHRRLRRRLPVREQASSSFRPESYSRTALHRRTPPACATIRTLRYPFVPVQGHLEIGAQGNGPSAGGAETVGVLRDLRCCAWIKSPSRHSFRREKIEVEATLARFKLSTNPADRRKRAISNVENQETSDLTSRCRCLPGT